MADAGVVDVQRMTPEICGDVDDTRVSPPLCSPRLRGELRLRNAPQPDVRARHLALMRFATPRHFRSSHGSRFALSAAL
jgi:hypothetical protein